MYNWHLFFSFVLIIPQHSVPTSPFPTPVHLLPQVLLEGVEFKVTEDALEVRHILVLREVKGEFKGGKDCEFVVNYLLGVG